MNAGGPKDRRKEEKRAAKRSFSLLGFFALPTQSTRLTEKEEGLSFFLYLSLSHSFILSLSSLQKRTPIPSSVPMWRTNSAENKPDGSYKRGIKKMGLRETEKWSVRTNLFSGRTERLLDSERRGN